MNVVQISIKHLEKENISMKRLFLVTMILVLSLSIVAFSAPPGNYNVDDNADSNKAKVYVIHGIPGKDLGLDETLPVDVLVNNSLCLLKGFKFGQIVGPVSLKAGTYNIKISLANTATPCSNAAVINADVPFNARETATVIAHLTEAGAPTASKYINNVTRLYGNLARVTIRHNAAAPTVDIGVSTKLGDLYFSTKIPGLSNPNQVGPARLPARSYDVTLYAAGTDTAVFGPTTLKLSRQTAYFIHAVGSLSKGTFTYIVQSIDLSPDD